MSAASIAESRLVPNVSDKFEPMPPFHRRRIVTAIFALQNPASKDTVNPDVVQSDLQDQVGLKIPLHLTHHCSNCGQLKPPDNPDLHSNQFSWCFSSAADVSPASDVALRAKIGHWCVAQHFGGGNATTPLSPMW
jgi:hypothetical protein